MISLQHLILKPNELIKWNNNNNNNNHDDDEIEKEKADNNLPRCTPNPHCLIFTFGIRNIPLWKERQWWSEEKKWGDQRNCENRLEKEIKKKKFFLKQSVICKKLRKQKYKN